jgi:murein DD-endopeptidase MepM/ murein hydrolase activator NlpD
MLVNKTPYELSRWVAVRRDREARWRAWFAARAGDSIRPTPESAWIYPLETPARLLDNYWNRREEGPHGALDIFLREGSWVRSPVSGVVIAAGDGWRGGWIRRRGLWYEGGGLSRRAGNGVLIFDPSSGGYHYMVHFQDGVLVRAGDVVRAGQRVGKVGHTGNASAPGRGRHLHYAYKLPATECGLEDMLVGVDPYDLIRAARARTFR